jgi:UDP-glucose 4-epimerase
MGLRILVTGGAGYIGAATGRVLLDEGHEVVALDSLSNGHRAAVPEGVRLVVGDVGDPVLLDRLFAEHKFDAVMHFAALAEVGESMKAPARYFRNNTVGTLTLLEACATHNVLRFVFSSTCAIFGEPESSPIVETLPKHPVNPYGESKLQTERMLEWFQRIHGLRYAALRYFNACGAWKEQGEHHDPESHLIPNILQVALGKRDAISIFGTDYPTPDGTCVRDYVHVYDLATAHVLSLRALDAQPALHYNLGIGRGFSVREVIEAARRVTGRPIPAKAAPRRPGDPPFLVANSERVQRELGWKPRFATLDSIMQSAWDWHVAHPEGYREK